MKGVVSYDLESNCSARGLLMMRWGNLENDQRARSAVATLKFVVHKINKSQFLHNNRSRTTRLKQRNRPTVKRRRTKEGS